MKFILTNIKLHVVLCAAPQRVGKSARGWWPGFLRGDNDTTGADIHLIELIY